jgi:hypothetical protein
MHHVRALAHHDISAAPETGECSRLARINAHACACPAATAGTPQHSHTSCQQQESCPQAYTLPLCNRVVSPESVQARTPVATTVAGALGPSLPPHIRYVCSRRLRCKPMLPVMFLSDCCLVLECAAYTADLNSGKENLCFKAFVIYTSTRTNIFHRPGLCPPHIQTHCSALHAYHTQQTHLNSWAHTHPPGAGASRHTAQ